MLNSIVLIDIPGNYGTSSGGSGGVTVTSVSTYNDLPSDPSDGDLVIVKKSSGIWFSPTNPRRRRGVYAFFDGNWIYRKNIQVVSNKYYKFSEQTPGKPTSNEDLQAWSPAIPENESGNLYSSLVKTLVGEDSDNDFVEASNPLVEGQRNAKIPDNSITNDKLSPNIKLPIIEVPNQAGIIEGVTRADGTQFHRRVGGGVIIEAINEDEFKIEKKNIADLDISQITGLQSILNQEEVISKDGLLQYDRFGFVEKKPNGELRNITIQKHVSASSIVAVTGLIILPTKIYLRIYNSDFGANNENKLFIENLISRSFIAISKFDGRIIYERETANGNYEDPVITAEYVEYTLPTSFPDTDLLINEQVTDCILGIRNKHPNVKLEYLEDVHYDIANGTILKKENDIVIGVNPSSLIPKIKQSPVYIHPFFKNQTSFRNNANLEVLGKCVTGLNATNVQERNYFSLPHQDVNTDLLHINEYRRVGFNVVGGYTIDVMTITLSKKITEFEKIKITLGTPSIDVTPFSGEFACNYVDQKNRLPFQNNNNYNFHNNELNEYAFLIPILNTSVRAGPYNHGLFSIPILVRGDPQDNTRDQIIVWTEALASGQLDALSELYYLYSIDLFHY